MLSFPLGYGSGDDDPTADCESQIPTPIWSSDYEANYELSVTHPNWKITMCDSDYHVGEMSEIIRVSDGTKAVVEDESGKIPELLRTGGFHTEGSPCAAMASAQCYEVPKALDQYENLSPNLSQ